MKRLALAIGLFLAGVDIAGASASALVAPAASAIGTQVSANLVRTPYAGLGVFASRWDTESYGTLSGYGLRLGWNIYGPLSLEGRASYYESDGNDVTSSLIPLEAMLVWQFRIARFLMPYVGGGIGYYLWESEYDGEPPREESAGSAGYFGLAGLNLHLGFVSLFAEAKYNLISMDEDLHWRGSDLEAENGLDGLSYTIGLKLGF